MLYVWLGALAIGITLGLLGSGGSILTVPVLVYLAGESEKVAITESLAIVGAIALAGAVPYALQRTVDWRSVAFFGGPGLVGAYLGATLARFVPGPVQLVFFAVVMLAAAWTMYRGRRDVEGEHPGQALWMTAALGLSVGVMTGLVGVGGGFLIVPALVLLLGLPMRLAVGTSLCIIVLNSLSGFLKYLDVLSDTEGAVDWRLVGLFVAVGVVGSFIGNRVSRRVPQAALRRGFAVFLVVMAAFILWREVPEVLGSSRPEAPVAAVSSPPSNDPTFMFSFLRGRATPGRLSPDDFRARLTDAAVVLDVRTPGEFGQGHLEGARNLDFLAPTFRQQVETLDRERPYFLYCRSGNRSGQAAEQMRAMGFEEVHNVGGFDALARAGFPTAR